MAASNSTPDHNAGSEHTERRPGRGEGGERRRGGGWLAFALGSVLVVGVLYVGRGVLIPLAIAILLTFLLSPLVTRLRRVRVPRVPAVLLTTLFGFTVLGALALLLGAQATQLATELPAYQANLVSKLRGLQNAAPGGGIVDRLSETVQLLRAEVAEAAPEMPADEAEDVPVVQVQEPPPTAFDVIANVAAPLVGPLGKAGIVIVLVIFMLLEREDLRNRLIRLLGPNLNVTTEVLDEAGSRVSRYLLMQLVVNVTYGVPLGVGLYFIGIPNAFLWAALAVVLRFIPYLGPVLSAAFPLLLALAVDPGWNTLLLTLGLILVLELISNNFIEPWLYGASTSISAVAIILAAIFWTSLWGPIGLLLATPLTVCLAVAGRYFPQLAFLDVLLGSAPALSMPERLYQRLLAGDVDESVAIAERHLENASLVELYDDVVLPALRLAAADVARRGLSDERRMLVMRTAIELVNELADHDEEGRPPTAEAVEERADAQPGALCVAGRSGLDLAIASIAGQLLERHGLRVRIVSAEALTPEHLPSCRLDDIDVVCLSFIDASAVPRAQQAIRRLARHASNEPLIVGLWSLSDAQRARISRLPERATIVGGLREMLTRALEAVTARRRGFVPAAIPEDEEERLRDIEALKALDANSEHLSRYTRRLSEAFGVPIALLNIVDAENQHFKGPIGLPDELAEAGCSPRDTSVCGHVVAENELVIVEDVLKDLRFAGNPFLLEHGIRFYAGAPLRTRRGHAIGSLCVIDASPRSITDEEKALLRTVADEAMAEIEGVLASGDHSAMRSAG